MPRDGFGREIDYLRISVTDRCNLRCVYCMPLSDPVLAEEGDVLSSGEIGLVVRAAVAVGFRRFRLTGGEPTLRADLLDIVARIAGTPGVADLAMTTNGVLLDLNMPRKNGWDTFERLSAEHPLVPVILITARPNQLFTAVEAGVGALLEKPLDIPILLQTITRLLAESVERRLARLAGRDVPFRYAAGKTDHPSKHGGSPSPPR